jgi:hypothetical protein
MGDLLMTSHEFNTAWQAWQQAAQNCQQASRRNFAASLGLAKAIYERHQAWLELCKLSPEFSPTMEAEMAYLSHYLPLKRVRQVEYKTLWAWLLSIGQTLESLQGLQNLSLNMLEKMQSAGLTAKEFDEACHVAASGPYEDFSLWLAEIRNQKADEYNTTPGLTKFKPYQFSGEGWQMRAMTVWDLAAEQGIELDPSWEYELKLTPKRLSIPPEHAPEGQPAHT